LVPHPPQLSTSVDSSTHSVTPEFLQAVSPAPHDAAHVPPEQTWVPVHANDFPVTVQPPQFFVSDVKSTHFPLHKVAGVVHSAAQRPS
jgi:hypothetical protein